MRLAAFLLRRQWRDIGGAPTYNEGSDRSWHKWTIALSV